MLLTPAYQTLYSLQEPELTAWPFSMSAFEQMEKDLQRDLNQMRRAISFINDIFQQQSEVVRRKRKLPMDKLQMDDIDQRQSEVVQRKRKPPTDKIQNRRGKSDGIKIKNNETGFSLSLDVKQFSPEELTVKVAGRKVTVEGKHEEKREDGETVFSYECSHFKKEVLLPEDVNSEEVTCLLSHNGELVIAAPRLSSPAVTGRDIPISITTDTSSGKEDENENADKTDNNKKQEISSNEGNEVPAAHTA
ncbi:heat shock protein 30C-like [Protopterus annectens]|uniref:heat shock protein 30C-like n=1 Tax=Protopterus annectens TaxID=7888 RepID=UPI001CFA348D|nr:heat shock protein 30C-like [Protopterus annectens]